MYQIINDYNIKSEVIEYLYKKTNINKFRYSIISFPKQLDYLKKNEHYVLLNIKTTHFFLIFKYFENIEKYLIVLIDRSSLEFSPVNLTSIVSKAKIYELKIHENIFQKLDKKLFRGTIMDGKYFSNRFYIYNVFFYKGENRVNESTLDSWNKITNDNISFIAPIEYYTYNDIPSLKCKFETNSINGLMFIPKIPENQYLYLYRDHFINKPPTSINNHSVLSNKESSKINVKVQTNCNNNTSVIHEIIKTELIDVYLVNIKDDTEHTNILYIPDIKTSIYCRKELENKSKTMLECRYIPQLSKWTPIIKS